MESSFPLLRLTDIRQCQPFWQVISPLLYPYAATIWKLWLPAFSCPWALMSWHEDAPQCLYPWWEAETLLSIVWMESLMKRGQGERDGAEEERKAKTKIWRKGCNQSVRAHGIPLALDVFIKGQGGDKALMSLSRSGALSPGHHHANIRPPASPVWQRARSQQLVRSTWGEFRLCKDVHSESKQREWSQSGCAAKHPSARPSLAVARVKTGVKHLLKLVWREPPFYWQQT